MNKSEDQKTADPSTCIPAQHQTDLNHKAGQINQIGNILKEIEEYKNFFNYNKPIVKFIPPAKFYSYNNEAGALVAKVYAIDHPLLGRQAVRTSLIVSINEDGSFETLNTCYKPLSTEEMH